MTLTIESKDVNLLGEIKEYLKKFQDKVLITETIDSDDISKQEYEEIKKIVNDSTNNEIVENSRKIYFL